LRSIALGYYPPYNGARDFGQIYMLQPEFNAWLSDQTKIVSGDIEWVKDADHPSWVEFRVPVLSDDRLPISIKGSFNFKLARTSFSVIHRTFGRIYGLDFGREHRNLDKSKVGQIHKHAWKHEHLSAHDAYRPEDITVDGSNPVAAWPQFCMECTIKHDGTLLLPPGFEQTALFEI
jgi:hypothetical protein